MQRFQVEPGAAKERPFVERNIQATRTALGLDKVEPIDFDYDPVLTEKAVDAEPQNLENARLLDPTIIQPTIQELQVDRSTTRSATSTWTLRRRRRPDADRHHVA